MTKDQGIFSPNEKVLCFHGPLIYEAKVLKAEKKEKEWTYLIHYAGWSKSWDDYVPESRLLKYNEENLKRQKEHKSALNTSVKSAKKSSTGGPKSAGGKRVGSVAGDSTTSSGNASATESRPSTPVEVKTEKGEKPTKASSVTSTSTEPKKRKIENTVEPVEPKEEKHMVKQEVNISLPEKLKVFLVDDWDLITRQKKLFTIPARKTVDNIFAEFIASRGDNPDQAAIEFCSGLRQYFNIMLGCQLLYRFERHQYGDVLRNQREDKTEEELAANPPQMSLIYGGPHLLRLLTKLGGCLSMTTLNQDSLMHLHQYMGYFFSFILLNYEDYLNPHDYGMSSPEYQRKSPV